MIDSHILTGVDFNTLSKKELFIHATINCLMDHGYAGTTVRNIAKYAEVTPGLLTHYFKGKEELIAETYLYLAKHFLDDFHKRASTEKDDPIEALRMFFAARVESEMVSSKLLKVWLTFWSMTLTHPELQHIHKETYNEYLKELKDKLIKACEAAGKSVAPNKIHTIAIGLNALLDGLWLEWSLDPTTFSVEEGLSIVTQFVEDTTGLSFT